jgi:hypothetical protein
MSEQSIKELIRNFLINNAEGGRAMPFAELIIKQEAERQGIDQHRLKELYTEVSRELTPGKATSKKTSDPLVKSEEERKKESLGYKLTSRRVIMVAAVVLLVVLAGVGYFYFGAGNNPLAQDRVENDSSATEQPLEDTSQTDTVHSATSPAAPALSAGIAAVDNNTNTNPVSPQATANAASLEQYMEKLSDASLPYASREEIKQQAVTLFANKNANVLIFTNNHQTGRETVDDYLDIVQLQGFKITIKDKKFNNDGKITQLSVIEQ